MTATTCLEDESILAFAQGRLPSEALAPVEDHLSICSQCRRVISEVFRLLGSNSSPALDVTAGGAGHGVPFGRAPLALHTRVARYWVRGVMGSGAAGVVYRAYDPELNREVALKFLRRDHARATGARLEARLRREAQTMARLSHPNVVSVFDVGTHEGSVFVVLELVEGQTLAEWLLSEHGWREIVAVFLEAGRGLAAAHARGIVHRDFKPANVLMGVDGRVCVTDFGLASSNEPAESWRELPNCEYSEGAAVDVHGLVLTTNSTHTRGLLGTPLFMAPEQFAAGRVDPRTDQFAFCVALYVGLFGVHPYLTLTAKPGSFAVSNLIESLNRGSLQVPNKSRVPPSLFQALRRGLQVLPEKRFDSMQALFSELKFAIGTPGRRAMGLGAPFRPLGGSAARAPKRSPRKL